MILDKKTEFLSKIEGYLDIFIKSYYMILKNGETEYMPDDLSDNEKIHMSQWVREKTIKVTLEFAANYAANTCLINGAF